MISRDRVLELFVYNSKTGELRNKMRRSANAMPGDVAGYIMPIGYRSVMVDKRRYYIHHLVLLIHHGVFPPKKTHVDHIDGDKLNNRFSNLRITTPSVNLHNRGLNKNNSTGFVGVYRSSSGTIYAEIMVGRKHIHIGSFPTMETAHTAREAFKAANNLNP